MFFINVLVLLKTELSFLQSCTEDRRGLNDKHQTTENSFIIKKIKLKKYIFHSCFKKLTNNIFVEMQRMHF